MVKASRDGVELSGRLEARRAEVNPPRLISSSLEHRYNRTVRRYVFVDYILLDKKSPITCIQICCSLMGIISEKIANKNQNRYCKSEHKHKAYTVQSEYLSRTPKSRELRVLVMTRHAHCCSSSTSPATPPVTTANYDSVPPSWRTRPCWRHLFWSSTNPSSPSSRLR